MHRIVSRLQLAALLALVLAVFATGAQAQGDAQARVRFFHAVPGAPNVDVYANDQLLAVNLAFGVDSVYFNLPAGELNFSVTETGTTTALFTQAVAVEPSGAYTLIAVGDPAAFQVYKTDILPLALGNVRFTAVHAISGASAVDVILPDNRAVVSSLQFGQDYGTLDLPAMIYELALVATGESLENALTETMPYALSSGASYTMVIYGTSAEPLVALLSTTTQSLEANAFVRVVHGASDVPAVDILANDALIVPSLEFRSTSPFIAVPAGEYNVAVRATGTEETAAQATLQLTAGEYLTVVASAQGAEVSLVSFSTTPGEIDPAQAALELLNASSTDVDAALQFASASVEETVPAGTSVQTLIAPNTGDALYDVSVNGTASGTGGLPFGTIYGGALYQVVLVGEDAKDVFSLPPVGLTSTFGSAPGGSAAPPVETEEAVATDEAVEATEAAVETEVVVEATEAATTAPVELTEVVTEEAVTAPTEVPPQPTQAPANTAAPTAAAPTGRVILDPGANLQLRQYPNSTALSLGLAPSGSSFEVRGRNGAPTPPIDATPNPSATPVIDPVTLLAENEDLDPDDTWLYVIYPTPDGGSISAWVNARYVDLRSPDGTALRLRNLAPVPSNRAGEAQNTSVTPPTARPKVVTVVIGGMDEGVNLQLRRTQSTDGESLALIPEEAEIDFIGLNEAGDWAFVSYDNTDDNTVVTGWVNARFIVEYKYQGNPSSLEEIDQRGLLEVIPNDRRGEVRTAPAAEAPTEVVQDATEGAAEPAATLVVDRRTIVGTVILNPGANLQFRRTANINGESLGLIPAGTELIIDGRTEDGIWLHTTFENQPGWVNIRYIGLRRDNVALPVEQIPVFGAPAGATLAPLPTTVGGTQPAPTATIGVEPVMTIEVDVVPLVYSPGGGGDGLPVLTRGREVFFVEQTGDGEWVYIRLDDGTLGWVPGYAVRFKDPSLQ